MRRRRVVILALFVVVVVAVVATMGGGSDDKYKFTAVFDTAQGIVPGQLVKIGGARVGNIDDVTLTPDNKARFSLSVKKEFGPFHDDANCKILPEGFISESFIQCDPGTPGRPDLGRVAGSGGSGPTVPIRNTSATVQLQQVLDTFSLSVTDRLRLMLTELGVTAAGRAGDLNKLLRRSNPALGQTRQLLAVLNSQRRSVREAVTQTDEVLKRLSVRKSQVRGFVDRAANVTDNTAAHQRNLREDIKVLPPLLRQAETSLSSIRTLSNQLTPTATALGRVAPSLTQLENLSPELAKQTRPALKALNPAFRQTRLAAGPANNVATDLTKTMGLATSTGKDLAPLLESSRKAGAIEGVNNLIYSLAVLTAPFDQQGHTVFANFVLDARCITDQTARGCRYDYQSEGKGQIPKNDPSLDSLRRNFARSKKPMYDRMPKSDARDFKKVLDVLLGAQK